MKSLNKFTIKDVPNTKLFKELVLFTLRPVKQQLWWRNKEINPMWNNTCAGEKTYIDIAVSRLSILGIAGIKTTDPIAMSSVF